MPESPLSRLSEREFGVPTKLDFHRVTVNTTVTEVLQNNPARLGYLIMNRSAQSGAVWFSRDVSAANGILLSSSGGFFGLHMREDGEVVGYALYGISEVAAGEWVIAEVEAI